MLSAARSSEELVCLLWAGEKGVTGLQQQELSPQACISDTSCEVSNPRAGYWLCNALEHFMAGQKTTSQRY